MIGEKGKGYKVKEVKGTGYKGAWGEMGTWGALGCVVAHFKVFCIFAALLKIIIIEKQQLYGRM